MPHTLQTSTTSHRVAALHRRLADTRHRELAHSLSALAYAATAHATAARLTHRALGPLVTIGSDQPLDPDAHTPFRSALRLRARRLLDRLEQAGPGPNVLNLTAKSGAANNPALPVPPDGARSALGVVIPAGLNAWAGFVLDRAGGEPRFEPDEIACLRLAAEVVAHAWTDPTRQPQPTPATEAHSDALDALSQTERRIARLLVNGLTEQAVADRLGRSRHTVHVHVKSVYRKLGLNRRAELRNQFAQALAHDDTADTHANAGPTPPNHTRLRQP
ncbi:MAG: LuxR C-terminal-related transcriptional regulator [Planctomycetota bacterium]